MEYIRSFFCCQPVNPSWLSHLIHTCKTKYRSSEWCKIFTDNYRYINYHSQSSVSNIHTCYHMRQCSEQLLDYINKDIQSPNSLQTAVGLFSSFIRMKYIDTVNPTQITVNRIKKNYEEFTETLKDSIVIYYRLDKLEGLWEAESWGKKLKSFVVDLVFQNDDWNQTVNTIQRTVDREGNQRTSFNMQKFEGIGIKEYGIKVDYGLNSHTLKLFDCQKQLQPNSPYWDSIQLVRQIMKERSPLMKLKKLQEVISSIEKCIGDFYSTYSLPKYQPLNADSLISILVYVLIQSKQSGLASHLKIIVNYINKEQLSSNLGYSLATIQACLQFIEKGNVKRAKSLAVSQSQLSLWLNLQSYFQQFTTEAP